MLRESRLNLIPHKVSLIDHLIGYKTPSGKMVRPLETRSHTALQAAQGGHQTAAWGDQARPQTCYKEELCAHPASAALGRPPILRHRELPAGGRRWPGPVQGVSVQIGPGSDIQPPSSRTATRPFPQQRRDGCDPRELFSVVPHPTSGRSRGWNFDSNSHAPR